MACVAAADLLAVVWPISKNHLIMASVPAVDLLVVVVEGEIITNVK